jgi:hypothetical protein
MASSAAAAGPIQIDNGTHVITSVLHPSVRSYLPALIKYSIAMEMERSLNDKYYADFAASFKKEFKFDIKTNKKKPDEKKQITLINKEDTVMGIKSWLSTYQKFISYITDHDLSNLILKYKESIDDDYKNKYIMLFQSSLLAYMKVCTKYNFKIGDKY